MNLVPMSELKEMATAMGAGKIFGKTREEILALMLIAQAEGKHPAIAAQEYHIIKGTPALKADAIQSRFQQAGGKIEWLKRTDKEVSAKFFHPQGGELIVTWTIEMAKLANLTGKDNWRMYPRSMLTARVKSEGVRALFPSCLNGMYSVEEVMDMEEDNEIKPAEGQKTTQQENPKQDISDIADIEDLTKEVFELLKTHARFVNDPDGYSEFEREIIGTTDLFTRGKKDKDVAALELLKARILYYAEYRGTELQEYALEIIRKFGETAPTEKPERSDVVEIPPEQMEIY